MLDDNTASQTPQENQPRPRFASLLFEQLKGVRGLGIACMVLALALAVALVRGGRIEKKSWDGGGERYGEAATLVPEKISKSASIPIRVPETVTVSEVRRGVTFDPPIEGAWLPGVSSRELLFKPATPLVTGKFYTVSVRTSSFQASADFYVDDDPAVTAIFPSEGSETHENSTITIVFNRPMVPLTTLAVLDAKEIPISITPPTEGKFKWISTRNLQFIPKERLRRSSEYTVAIQGGFTSVDGLALPASLSHRFTTRPLRYQSLSNNRIIYNQPISIVFNQPVDLNATIPYIRVENKNTGRQVPVSVRYGERRERDAKTGKERVLSDQAIVAVYQREDRHGRKELWDFDTSYELTIGKAVPLEGNRQLAERRTTNVTVPGIIESVSAQSERTQYARLDFFDPEGTLEVMFYEPIDLQRSKITAPGLKDIRFGTVCKKDEQGNTVYLGSGTCDKKEDRKILVLSFASQSLAPAQSVPVEFKKIFNESGLQINVDAIVQTITVHPRLTLLRTIPADGTTGGSLTEMSICTNTPLALPDTEDETKGSRVTSGIVHDNWQYTRYIDYVSSYSKCRKGEYETALQYGLLPLTKYTLGLHLEDDFGQTLDQPISFTSGDVESENVRISNVHRLYNVTSPGKTRLLYSVENIDYVDVHICKMNPETMLARLTWRPERTVPPSGNGCTETKQARIDLPRKFWTDNYFHVDIGAYFGDPLGHYEISVTHPKYRQWYNGQLQIYDRAYVTVTRLAVGEKRVAWNASWYSRYGDERKAKKQIPDKLTLPGENLYWVTSFSSLAPVSRATVTLYKKNDKALAYGATHLTDGSGIARAKVLKDIAGAIVAHGKDTAIVSNETDTLLYTSTAEEARKTYIYTDRPIYRQGHEVFIKGIDRIGYDGSYEMLRSGTAPLEIFNSRGESVYRQELPVSVYGTFDTRFVIPADAPLGTYRVSVFGSEHTFSVEAYIPAAFKLDLKPERDEYVAGERLAVTVDADYYFGVPVESGEVEYSVTSQDYHFDRFKDEYFNFGAGWYDCYDCGYGDSYLFRGKTTLDQDGHARIEEPLDFKKFYRKPDDEGSKIVTVQVTVRDSNGRSVSGQTSAIVHRGEVYLGVKPDKSFLPKNEQVVLRAKSVTTKGEPTRQGNITLAVERIIWHTFKREEVDGGFYYRSEKTTEPVVRKEISTDGDGSWSEAFSMADEGEYQVTVETTDRFGNVIRGKTQVYVYGEGIIDIRETNDYSLEVLTEKTEVTPGESPSVIIKSPYANAKALITVDRGKVFDYFVVDINRSFYDFRVPIKKEYAPNVYVSVLLLSPNPEIKFGQVQFTIDSKHQELAVEVTADKTAYLPGEKVNLSVVTKDYLGKAVPAEVSIAVADLSVLALKGNPKKNPFVFFYDGFPLTVKTSSNIKNVLYEKEIPVGTKGGGGDPEDLARRKRGEFKDTAFWSARVVTDARGMADVSFTLPDNLTTWQVESLGITEDTRVGVDYDEFIARKDLMVLPLKPRFVVPGDEFYIGAKLFNQTDATRKFSITIASDTLEFLDDADTVTSIGGGKTETQYFKVRAPAGVDKGSHRFTLSAKSDLYEDTVENNISITRNETYEAVATAGFTKSDQAAEYVHIPEGVLMDKGGLTINTNATMAVFLSDALNYLVEYPYGCSEQLASKLASIGVVKRGLNIKNVGDTFKLKDVVFEGKTYSVDEVVDIGLARIYENQHGSGGFSYYKTLQPNAHLTLHVLQALIALRQAGFRSVHDEVIFSSISRAASFISQTIRSNATLQKNNDFVIVAAYTLSLVSNADMGNLPTLVERIARDRKFVQEDISSVSLAYLSVLTEKGYAQGSKIAVFSALENRIDIDGRGAYLKGAHNNVFLDFYETPIKNTALLLKAIVASKTPHQLQDKIIRWLLRSRAKDGAWGSTNNTLAVIDALVDFLERERETESEFTLFARLGEKPLFAFDFNKGNVLETQTHVVPLSKLAMNKTERLDFTRANKNALKNNFYYDLALKYYLPIDRIPARDEGITVTRELYARADEAAEYPLRQAAVGEVVRGRLTFTVPKAYNFVAVEDFIPAGFELVNFKLSTEDQSLRPKQPEYDEYEYYEGGLGGVPPQMLGASVAAQTPGGVWHGLLDFVSGIFGVGNGAGLAQAPRGLPRPRDKELDSALSGGIAYYTEPTEKPKPLPVDFEEKHDDRVFTFTERLQPGVYEYEYYLRALVPGTFHHLPAVASEMYFPEVFGRTAGSYFTVTAD